MGMEREGVAEGSPQVGKAGRDGRGRCRVCADGLAPGGCPGVP